MLLLFGDADVSACPVALVNYAPVHWALGRSAKWSKDRRPFGDVKQSKDRRPFGDVKQSKDRRPFGTVKRSLPQ